MSYGMAEARCALPSKPPSLNKRVRRTHNWQHRTSATARGYGREHRAIRKQLLSEEPLCVDCEAEGRVEPAVIADHDIPLSQGGQTIRSNYKGRCKRHHDLKTARESLEGRRQWQR